MRGLLLCLWKDRRGQDFIEYALLAGAFTLAVAVVLPPTVMASVSSIFSRVTSVMGGS